MTEDRKLNQSIKMRARWEKCKKIAGILKIEKEIIFNNYETLDGYFPAIIRGNPDVINHVHGILEKKKGPISESDYVKKIKEEEKGKIENPINNKKENSAMEELKLMFWVINKIGSVEKAKKLFEAAILALESMNE